MQRLLLSGLILFTVGAPRGVLAQDETSETRVMIVGDSHVERLGPMLSRVVESSGMVALGSVARRGWSTRRFVEAGDLAHLLGSHGRPDVVVIALGGNDRPRDLERYREEIAWVVAQARTAGAERVLWLGPATSNAARGRHARRTGAWHEHSAGWQEQIVPSLDVQWIDSRPFTRRWHRSDGIHFTVRGYRGWARSAWTAADVPPVDRRSSASPPPLEASVPPRVGLGSLLAPPS